MKKSLLFFISLLVLCLFAGGVSAYSGSGTASDPFILSSPSDLQLLSGSGIATSPFSVSAYYELGADIDMSSVESFTPIGTNSYKFTGHFDGKNYTISNLTITGSSHMGFFNTISTGAVVSNIIFDSAEVTGSSSGGYIAILAKEIGSATISNVKIYNSKVSSNGDYVGGLCASCMYGDNTIIRGIELNRCLITTTSNQFLGGISSVGAKNMVVSDCKIVDCVLSVALNSIGGLFSRSGYRADSISIDNCSVLNCIISGASNGGIFGVLYTNNSNVSSCVVTNTYLSGNYGGGIFGTSIYTPSFENPSITISECTTSKCTMIGSIVGGIYCSLNSNYTKTITDCTVSDCSIIGTTNVSGVGN